MFGFLRRKKDDSDSANEQPQSQGVLASLRDRLSKTRHNLTDGMADLVLGKKSIDDDLLEQLENLKRKIYPYA